MPRISTIALALAVTVAPFTASAYTTSGVCLRACDGTASFYAVLPTYLGSLAVRYLGASWSSTYYLDGDGDSFGDGAGPTRPCVTSGYVAKSGDCDDANASVNPSAAEVCGNDIDDNCDTVADEGCVTCPCFTADDIAADRAEFLAVGYDSTTSTCTDYTVYGNGYSYDYATLEWRGSMSSDGIMTEERDRYYAIDYVDGSSATFCERWESEGTRDAATGAYISYGEDYQNVPLTTDEHAKCIAIILEAAATAEIPCTTTTYP
ncbi:MAG: putative metal-binding motif-containing protein [Myxococcales bacterium]|nr:putative metal-binding motif-containing protein [Myxococcales bacterium]